MATGAVNFQLLTIARVRPAHIGYGHAMPFGLEDISFSGLGGYGTRAMKLALPVFAQGCCVPISRGSPPVSISG
ncbi:MAG TPA: hypothetical protein VKV40_07290 [Ktedonobacteraceae bacterium]|nr:hypothetical protein [Ktedonobacteraceae bacterium]